MQTHFEQIFNEPDIIDTPDEETGAAYASYPATATRTGKLWSVVVRDLPAGHAVHAQGATWAEAELNAIKALIGALQAEPGTVGVQLAPADEEAAAALEAVTQARIARAYAEQAERDAVRRAARLLTDQGWTTRDAGGALRLSHQRISQIAPRATA
ncbi:type II toxin-antitoxin system HicB family antitoxin [Nonomuraea sp. NPDC049750]|uniref:type II toxin-antitoxin system HicB family antitoxin n=1 Tax=Nonomuraea sp. NPDC049750 TaxID=3154738 RepID=UPI0033DB5BAD